MINWDECISGQTILVNETSGGKSLFLLEHDSYVFYYSLEYRLHRVDHVNGFHDHKIEHTATAIDLDKLVSGKSVLASDGEEFIYLFRTGNVLMVSYNYGPEEKALMSSVFPESYATWTVVKYE